jgi:uncharacterized protein DUF1573
MNDCRPLLGAFLVCLLALSAAAADPPRIAIEKPVLDFGPVVFGKKLSHAFVVRNPGASALRIEEVTSRCDCFHATFDEAIAPGTSGKIHVEVDTSALQGPIFLTVRVRTNDPARPIARIEIKALVKGPIMLLPRDHIDLTTVSGQDQEGAVDLEVSRKDPLQVTSVESDSEVFIPRLEKVLPGRHYRIVVKAQGNQPVGMHSGTVRIHTSDKDRAVVPLQCSLLVVSSVAVEPDTLYLQTLTQDEARKGVAKDRWKVVVKNLRGTSFAVEEIKSDASFVRTRVRMLPDGKSYDLFVELLPNEVLRPGRSVVTLHVKTNLPDAQDVKVPVWVEVR